ncbi:hypothetical protein JOC36_000791 [Weissella uvarum]|uniref:hypothetical protein n=1 Tax=Lactobacillaceae TaxID=33958 RepID=UPI001961BCCB|nr:MULTISPECIES: hypothetical protein [Lactobacillaceae]MBM7617242.1 hypothetical protein [Weissella uvarum]MCM0595168.1 hypothetical protein [Weissella uvarum]MCM0601522.1 hypothetical protein [Periweissella ghanensis]
MNDFEETDIEIMKKPNDFKYRKYSKVTHEFIAGTDEPCDSTDVDFATTDVLLPDEVANYVFDESIQMWRGMDNEAFLKYKTNLYVPTASADDKWKAAVTAQNTFLMQQNLGLTKTITDLSSRVMELEAQNSEKETEGVMTDEGNV